ncbi:hypothetical protein TNIN_334791 [Trichonephila inaurata madagascariensis]|uniref:Uncharacterized protein n=1 Tax=Trichonephila inaurata madagascariensis TaxID=2747483 RepID=A0A8X6WU73_9ARAC|nr:hypothetical protein TNIN_334791 [Trichonephila inaurata madagascariensis]
MVRKSRKRLGRRAGSEIRMGRDGEGAVWKMTGHGSEVALRSPSGGPGPLEGDPEPWNFRPEAVMAIYYLSLF